MGKFSLLTTNIVILQHDNYTLLVLSLSTKTVQLIVFQDPFLLQETWRGRLVAVFRLR